MDITRSIVARREKALLNGDYALYKKQLTRRLLIARRRLHYVSGRGKKYTARAPICAEQVGRDHGFAEILLLEAERAWAQAMHMRVNQSSGSGTQNHMNNAARRQNITKFHKSAHHAGLLLAALSDVNVSGATQINVLEAYAYSSMAKGLFMFQKHDWAGSLRYLSEAFLVYRALASADATNESSYQYMIKTCVDPSIRYAAYQTGIPRSRTTESIAQQQISTFPSGKVSEALELSPKPDCADGADDMPLSKDDDAAKQTPQIINWRSRTVRLEDAALAQAVGRINQVENALAATVSRESNMPAKAQAAACDELLLASQDSVDAAKTAINELLSEGIDMSDGRVQSLQVAGTAMTYALLERRIGRNRMLCGAQDGAVLEPLIIAKSRRKSTGNGQAVNDPRSPVESRNHKLKRLRERIALYDATLQSLESALILPGVAGDEQLTEQLDAKRSYFRGLRCFAIARSYGLQGSRKEALALSDKAGRYLSSAQKCPSLSSKAPPSPSDSLPNSDVKADQLQSIVALVNDYTIFQQASSHLLDRAANARESASKNGMVPLIETLDEYPETEIQLSKPGSIVTFPPRLQPVPVKPIFLDLAFNYIEYPGSRARQELEVSEVKTQAKTSKISDLDEKQEKKEKKGWFGFGR